MGFFALQQQPLRSRNLWTPPHTPYVWLRHALSLIQYLLNHLTPLIPKCSKSLQLQMYCDYWWSIVELAERRVAASSVVPTWEWWLEITNPATAQVPGIHEIHIGHRLFTHFHAITNPIKNLTPAAEKHDIATCLMRRAWTPRLSLKAFHERMRKLCTDGQNKRSRAECQLILYKLYLAARLGFLASITEDGGDRRTLLREWHGIRTNAVIDWKTDLEPNMPLIAEALSAYVHDYVYACPALKGFLLKHFPNWPKGPGNSATAACWIPCQSLTFLRVTMLSNKTLRKLLATTTTTTASSSDDYDVELDTEAVLDCVPQVAGANQLIALRVLAHWHGHTRLISDLVALLQQFQNHVLTKSRLRKLLLAWYTHEQDRPTLLWLLTVVNVWAGGTLVRTMPAPYQWTVNVTDNYARQEQLSGVTISPMTDVFLYCPTCLRICSIVTALIAPTRKKKKKKKKRKITPRMHAMDLADEDDNNNVSNGSSTACGGGGGGGGAGFEHVVVDVDHGAQLMCASRKSGLTALQCTQTQLQQIHMTGQILYFHERVFLLCPQPYCGRLMQLEAGVCKYTEHGPCCRYCTFGLTQMPDETDEAASEEPAPMSLTELFESVDIFHKNEKLFDD